MSNKKVREELEKLYGAECFIEKLHLRKDDKPRRYKSKGQMKKMKKLTYHHMVQFSQGGKATIETGALLSNENHVWFHKQSKSMQECMNAAFREYKKQVDECRVTFEDIMDVPYEVKVDIFYVDEKARYNRVNRKREDREIIKEWEENEL